MTTIRDARIALLSTLLFLPIFAAAGPCANDDPEKQLTGIHECLSLRLFRSTEVRSNPELVVVLHGDTSSGGPVDYHRELAERIAIDSRADNLVVAALLRPGYRDGDGNESSGIHNGKTHQYTADSVDEIAAVIGKLVGRLHTNSVTLLGHSGGGAISAILLGRHPELASGAVLIACPCVLSKWPISPRPRWPSESPDEWAAHVPLTTRVFAITGSRDKVTSPKLAQQYIASLSRRGVVATFEVLPGAGHHLVIADNNVIEALFEILNHPISNVKPGDWRFGAAMGLMVFGLTGFIGTHLLPSVPTMRRRITARIGSGIYKGGFSVVSAGSLLLLALGMSNMDFLPLWNPPAWGDYVPRFFMPFSMILIAAAYMPGNLRRVLRHPMLWGVVLWAGSHLFASGDLASIILFSSFGGYSLFAMWSQNRRGLNPKRVHQSGIWDILAVTTGLATYIAIGLAHRYIAGVPAFY